MNESAYLNQVASGLNFRHYVRQGPWGKKSGSVIGERDGYVTIIGFTRAKREEKLVILVRFKTTNDPATIKTMLAQNPALATKKRGTLAAVGKDFLRWDWVYRFAKPNAQDVVQRANELREALKPLAPGFDARCEKCGSTSTTGLTLWNGMPSYICPGCQQRVRQELNQEASTYEMKDPNYVNGMAFGVGAALAGGVAWGLVAYGLHYIFLYGAILIGYFVAWAMLKGTGKVTLSAQILIPTLTVASVLFGDALFFTLTVMKANDVPFSLRLLARIITHLWQIETAGGNVLSVVFALVGAGYALYRARKPKFQAAFEPLSLSGA